METNLNPDYLNNLISSTTLETVESISEILHIELQQDKEAAIIPKINNLLNNSKTRLLGLQLLDRLVPHFSNDGFNGNYSKWLNICGNQGKNETQQEVTLNILTKLLEVGKNNDGFIKKFSSECLSSTIHVCLNLKYHKQVAVECLINCLNIFPSALGNQKIKIETFLLECLESLSEEEAKSAGVAFHFLQQAGPGGVNGVNYGNNYFTQLRKLCVTLHLFYDQFFDGYEEVYVYQEISEDPYTLKPILNNLDYLDILSKRIINCTFFIRMMICKRYPVEKRIIPKNIVDVVCRGLSLHICLSQDTITKKARFQSLLLNKIQLHLLELFQTVICSIFVGVIPFSHTIISTLANCMRRTSNCKCFIHNLSFKNNIYRTLNKWVLFSKNVNHPTFADIVLPSILNDCLIFEKSSVSLKNRTKTDKNRIIKAESNNTQALELLETVLNSWSNKLQTKEILKLTISAIVEVNKNRKSNFSTVYQLKLYQLLSQFSRTSDFPVNVIAHLFNEGHQNEQLAIRTAVSHGLQQIQQICNPICHSLRIEKNTDMTKNSDAINLDQPITKVVTDIDHDMDDIAETELNIIKSPEVVTAETSQLTTTTNIDEEECTEEKSTEDNFIKIDSKIENNVLNTVTSEDDVSKTSHKQRAESADSDISEEPLTKKIRVEETEDDMLSAFQDIPQD